MNIKIVSRTNIKFIGEPIRLRVTLYDFYYLSVRELSRIQMYNIYMYGISTNDVYLSLEKWPQNHITKAENVCFCFGGDRWRLTCLQAIYLCWNVPRISGMKYEALMRNGTKRRSRVCVCVILGFSFGKCKHNMFRFEYINIWMENVYELCFV